MDEYQITIDPRFFLIKGLSTTEIRLLALIEDFTKHRGNFTLTDRELGELFDYTGHRQIQKYIKDLDDKGIIYRYSYGFYDHSRKYKSGFVKRRNIKINYDILENLIDGK